MITTCWSVKGGSGTTVVAASLAVLATQPKRSLTNLSRARFAVSAEGASATPRVLLVDLAGDLPAVFGISDPPSGLAMRRNPEAQSPGLGLSDWLFADHGVDASSLERLITPIKDGLSLLQLGQSAPIGRTEDIKTQRIHEALEWSHAEYEHVIVDAGSVSLDLAFPWIEQADRSVLVIRPCYLSLRHAIESPLPAHAVVVVSTDGRTLDSHDVSAVLGVRHISTVPFDPEIARLVDSGLFGKRIPRSVEKLRQVAA